MAVDLRRAPSTFGRWVSVTPSPEECNQLWVPVGFAHGFCTLEPNTVISYRVTDYYSPENDKGVAWDDPDIGIEWPFPADELIPSERDLKAPNLKDVEDELPFVYEPVAAS